MKYVIVIPDGCADEPQESLGGRTPLQAARTPEMDRIAHVGVVGRSNNVPDRVHPGQRRGDPEPVRLRPAASSTPAGRRWKTAAMGIALGPDDWAIRCNLVTSHDGR